MSKRDNEKTLRTLKIELARMEGYKIMLKHEGITDTPSNDAVREELLKKIAELK